MTEIKVLDKGFVRLVDIMGDDAAIVQAARCSYGDGTKTVNEDRGLIRYLMRHWHTSPFEMVEFKFHIKLPIFVERQLIRHRTANVNEYSSRYSLIQDEFYVPEPERVKAQSKNNKQGSDGQLDKKYTDAFIAMTKDTSNDAVSYYQESIEMGVARELARINVPVNNYTEMYWKCDLNNIFHLLQLRMDSHAQWEIQQYANAMYELIKPIVPLACEAFEDYRLGAKTFSKQEMALIKDIIRTYQDLNDYKMGSTKLGYNLESFSLLKREQKEFLSKLDLSLD